MYMIDMYLRLRRESGSGEGQEHFARRVKDWKEQRSAGSAGDTGRSE